MKELFKEAIELMESGRDFVYTAVINKDGSAPSDVGARMIVLEDSIVGTIGGGGVEADVISFARDRVFKEKNCFVRGYDLSKDGVLLSEYICGGSTRILIRFVDAGDEETALFFKKAYEAVNEDKRAWIIYSIFRGRHDDGPPGSAMESWEALSSLAITVEDEGLFGRFEGTDEVKREMALNPLRLSLHAEPSQPAATNDHASSLQGAAQPSYVIDRLGTCGTMYIMGGGHVSLEVAELAKKLDFNVTVTDDRKEYANPDRFPGCRTIVVDSYEDIPDLKVGSNTYILIITRGHMGDFEALKWALARDPFYVGMIGSKKKREILYDKLRALGVSEEKIASVHSPIGLPIGAKTPAEIAVSIMAEIIKCRYEV